MGFLRQERPEQEATYHTQEVRYSSATPHRSSYDHGSKSSSSHLPFYWTSSSRVELLDSRRSSEDRRKRAGRRMGMNCYDGDTCIQWHPCEPGQCRVRERVAQMQTREFENAQTQIIEPIGLVSSFEPLSEEAISEIRERFQQANHKAQTIWGINPVIQPNNNRKHVCVFCWIVGLLPWHHRCPHGRLVCERCEVEAAGW